MARDVLREAGCLGGSVAKTKEPQAEQGGAEEDEGRGFGYCFNVGLHDNLETPACSGYKSATTS